MSQVTKRKANEEQANDETLSTSKKFKQDESDSDTDYEQIDRNRDFIKAARNSKSNSKEIEKLFANVDINFADSGCKGNTALHFAAKNGNIDAIKFLLKNGAKPNVANKDNKMPVDLAKSEEVKKLLIVDVLQPQSLHRPTPVAVQPKDDSLKAVLPSSKTKGGNMKSFLHGITYQHKMLLLTLLTGRKHEDDFCLSTEMGDAEKFDDIVYVQRSSSSINDEKKNDNEKEKTQKVRKIAYGDLITNDPNLKYGLLKYFISYRLINKRFFPFKTEDFVICTNIGLSSDLQTTHDIEIKPVSDTFFGNQFQRFKITPKESSPLFTNLREASDMWILAKTLVEDFTSKKPLSLRTPIYVLYHILLFKCNILLRSDDTEDKDKNLKKLSLTAKFNPDFIMSYGKISKEAENFYAVISKVLNNDKKKLSELGEIEIEISEEFGKKYDKYFEELSKSDCDNFAKKVAKIFSEYSDAKENTKTIKYRNDDDVIGKMAYKILFFSTDNKTVEFSPKFFDEKSPLNLYQSLQEQLKTDFDKLRDLKIAINNYHTCFEGVKPVTNFAEGDIDAEIKQFFNSLIFLKTPADDIIVENIDQNLQGIQKIELSDVAFPRSYMNDVILTWMSKKAGGYISKEDSEIFINEIIQKLVVIQFVGINSRYCSELETNAISFEDENTQIEVRRFLNDDSQKLLHIKSDYYYTAAIKTYQVITELYRNKDAFIFDTAKYLLKPEVMENLKLALHSKLSMNLLILICEKSINFEEILQFTTFMEEFNKKMILITNSDHASIENMNDVIDKTNFLQMTKSAQQRMLDYKVKFQGRPLILNKVAEKSSINSDLFIKLLQKRQKSKMVKIGQAIKPFVEYNDKYYFARCLKRNVKFDLDILENCSKNDLFVISNHDKYDFTSNKTLERFIDEELILFYYDEKKFSDYKGNVHFFDLMNNKLWWIKSKGSPNLLLNKKSLDAFEYTEEDFIKRCFEEKLIVIENVAGMGKSTILTSLALAIKQEYSDVWVIKVELNTLKKVLKRYETPIKPRIFWKFIIYGDTATTYEKKIFNEYLNNGKVIVILDGYDEIYSYHEKIINPFLEKAKAMNIRLWITTRKNSLPKLENIFNCISFSLKPFSGKEANEFLCKFWMCNFKGNVNTRILERVKHYASVLIKVFNDSIKEVEKLDFIGIPLQLKMLAEIFQENLTGREQWQGCYNYLELTDEKGPELPEKLSLYGIYEMFVEKKFNIVYMEKNKVYDEELCAPYKRERIQAHKYLAVYKLLDSEMLDALLTDEECNVILPNILANIDNNTPGITSICQNGDVEFVHLTFAEFFAVTFLNEKADNPNAEKIEEIVNCLHYLWAHCSPAFINFVKHFEFLYLCFGGMNIEEMHGGGFITGMPGNYNPIQMDLRP